MSGTFSHELSIDLPVAPVDAWNVIGDYGRDPDWRRGVTMRHEPLGLVQDGTRTFEDLKFLGSIHRTVARIADVVPGRAFRFRSDDGSVEGYRRVELTPGGCRVVLGIEVKVQFALMAPIVGWLYRREVRGNLRRLAVLVGAPKGGLILQA
jgi:hypothetical protein